MKTFSPDEIARLLVLDAYEILDSPPEESFDRVARLASEFLQTPIALVSLVDESRQWFKAKVGVDAKETPREHAFCAHAILQPQVMVVPNALEDDRFCDNPLVTGPPFIRFYAGVPLKVSSGHNLGTLCVIDREPRSFTLRESKILADLAAIVIDELELRKHRAMLQEALATTSFALQTSQAGVFWIYPTGVLKLSPECKELLGYVSDEASGDVFSWLAARVHPQDFAQFQAYCCRVRGGVARRVEEVFRFYLDSEQWRWLALTAAPMKTSGRTVGLFRDVSVERQAKEDLEHSNAELKRFAHVASHDLKAPLRGIEHTASWIAEDCEDLLPEDSKTHLRLLLSRVVRMKALLQDLLTYARVGSWRDTERFEILAAIRDAVEDSCPPEGTHIDLEGQEIQVQGHRVPLEQIVRNLVSNAIKHHDRDVIHIQIAVRNNGAMATIDVVDDGPGIAPRFHARIFEMVTTLAPRDQVEGSGLGLAIVQRIVHQHGGTLEVSSEGRGTSFSFSWPICWE